MTRAVYISSTALGLTNYQVPGARRITLKPVNEVLIEPILGPRGYNIYQAGRFRVEGDLETVPTGDFLPKALNFALGNKSSVTKTASDGTTTATYDVYSLADQPPVIDTVTILGDSKQWDASNVYVRNLELELQTTAMSTLRLGLIGSKASGAADITLTPSYSTVEVYSPQGAGVVKSDPETIAGSDPAILGTYSVADDANAVAYVRRIRLRMDNKLQDDAYFFPSRYWADGVTPFAGAPEIELEMELGIADYSWWDTMIAETPAVVSLSVVLTQPKLTIIGFNGVLRDYDYSVEADRPISMRLTFRQISNFTAWVKQ